MVLSSKAPRSRGKYISSDWSDIILLKGRANMVPQQIAPFTQGELVRILSGPFSGLVGRLGAISDDHRILKISLRFFGRRHTAEVFVMDVEKVA